MPRSYYGAAPLAFLLSPGMTLPTKLLHAVRDSGKDILDRSVPSRIQRADGLTLGFVDECQAPALDLEDGAVLLKPGKSASTNPARPEVQIESPSLKSICSSTSCSTLYSIVVY